MIRYICDQCTTTINWGEAFYKAILVTMAPGPIGCEEVHFCTKRCRRIWLIKKMNEEQREG